jgi:hypothetical protein
MEGWATLILAIHLAWIVWVVLGALWTRSHPLLAMFHILSLGWGIIVEVSPWPCPLTLAEQFFLNQEGANAYKGGFLLHCLDGLVYPAIPDALITTIGVAVCACNIAVYFRRYWKARSAPACK